LYVEGGGEKILLIKSASSLKSTAENNTNGPSLLFFLLRTN
jgi:hypothetical protein